ncbi:unnamed protein product [marine sediment metagenome]|uniref:Uncharacterized protein n=1 Tax=marine sediment metagenome TaxID=412755 RepID=X1SFH5_9ZZZZ
MKRRKFLETTARSSIVILGLHNLRLFEPEKITVAIQQITNGPKHHLFGYIGQSLTIPWNSTGTLLLTLRSTFHDHLPDGHEPADVALVHLDQPERGFL